MSRVVGSSSTSRIEGLMSGSLAVALPGSGDKSDCSGCMKFRLLTSVCLGLDTQHSVLRAIPGGDQFGELVRRHGPADMIALRVIAVRLVQELQRLRRFDPLAADLELQAV